MENSYYGWITIRSEIVGKDYVMNAIKDIEVLAKQEGLDFFPTIFEFVDKDIMLEGCTYGLPRRSRHWSYGRSYQQQKLYGEMGFSKVYEIVFNNDPAYAFLLNTNPDVINIMVGAHVFAHCHFFKRNVMFQGSDRNMIYRAAERATRVDKYIEQYGLDKVEHLMDIGFALDNHIDWNKGVFRKKYPKKRTIECVRRQGEFDDLLNIGNNNKRSVVRKVVGSKLPPRPEKDLLWFLVNYAPLDDWERDVLNIAREESFYFYPIVMTKIINEGFAVFFHSRLMQKYEKLSEREYFDYAKVHSGVVNPGNPFNINPYYLGFKILEDIEKRWDEKYENGESEINGTQKVFEVVAEEDDSSFLRNYLTKDLVRDLGLFNYGYRNKRRPGEKENELTEEDGIIELKDRDLDKIVENLTRHTVNYGAPLITINEADGDTLVLEHRDDFGPLDEKYTEKVLEYIYELWGGPIELKTYIEDSRDKSEKVTFIFDESGFDIQ
jgi:stage V sporulation protein R